MYHHVSILVSDLGALNFEYQYLLDLELWVLNILDLLAYFSLRAVIPAMPAWTVALARDPTLKGTSAGLNIHIQNDGDGIAVFCLYLLVEFGAQWPWSAKKYVILIRTFLSVARKTL